MEHTDKSSLEELRQRIQEIDAEFASLLVERQRLAQEVIAAKTEKNMPLRNYSVERRVIERFKGQCRQNGLDESWGVELAALLIRCAVEMQSKILDRRQRRDRLGVLIVGGAGKMGRWLCSFFSNQGHEVRICDPGAETEPLPFEAVSLEEGLTWASVAIISTPMQAAAQVLSSLVAAPPSCVVIDICSIKKPLISLIRQGVSQGMKIGSLHPLFGPDVRTLHGRNLVICPCGSPEADAMLHDLFADTAATMISLSLEEHDRLMSATLAFSHAVNIIFGSALMKTGIAFKTLQQVASSTFAKQLNTTRDVFAENPDLYFEIQQQADYDTTFALLEESLQNVRSIIRAADNQQFRSEMADVQRYFSDH